jgi:outer membrane protein assembly factor BamB
MTSRSRRCCAGATVLTLLAGTIVLGAFAITGLFADRQAIAEVPASASASKGDHTMFGGTPERNFVNLHSTGLSHEFPKSEEDEKVRVLGNRVKWKESLGSRAYGGPIVAGGKVFVGTNNENPRSKRDRGKATDDYPEGPPVDKGILMCFDEKTGKFLWQMVHDKLASGQVHDWPREGLCSTPTVVGDRIFYCSNRCDVVCLDVNGFLDGRRRDLVVRHDERA